MSTPSRSCLTPSGTPARQHPSRTGSSTSNTSSTSNSSSLRTPGPKAGASATSTPARLSMREQIAALRAAQATPVKSAPGTPAKRKEEVKALIRKAADTGRLVIPNTLDPPLQHLPPALYTLLLGIPARELSRKPPRPPAVTGPSFGLNTPDKLAAKMESMLSLDNDDDGDAFGIGGRKKGEDDEDGPWMGATDLETLKVVSQEMDSLDLELGLFGGLKVLDFRHNKLTAVPSSMFNLTLLTYLNLSYNSLTEFPAPVTLLPSLIELHLGHNSLQKLSFAMPPPSPIFPSSPPTAFASPPPPGETPDRPLPSLQILHLEGNKITYSGLPDTEDEWPPRLAVLNLAENPLLPSRGGTGELSLGAFEGLPRLKRLSLPSCGIRTLATKGRETLKQLELVDLKGNQWLVKDGLEVGWGEREVKFLSGETGEESNREVTILLDPHLIPSKTLGRRTFAPSAPPPAEESQGEFDLFGAPLSSSTVPPPGANGRRGGKPPPKPLSFGGGFDDFDAPPPTEAELRVARAKAAQQAEEVAAATTQAEPALDGPGPYTTPYNASARSFTLALTSRTPHALFPTGEVDLSTLHAQSFASTLLALSLSGRNLKLLAYTPDLVFPSVRTLSLTACHSCKGLKEILPLIPDMFPALEHLDLSETNVGEEFFNVEAGGVAVKLLLREGGGLKTLKVREAGVKGLAGLEIVAVSFKAGEGAEGWRCEEVELADNLVEKLEPVLGYLPLRAFNVERNCFRQPAARVWEKGGTAGLLLWLKERADLDA